MKDKAKYLVSGSILRMVEFFSNAIIGLALMPFIIHSLGDKMYGLWIFIRSFLGYYGLMDFGITTAIQRYVSKAIGSKDYSELNKIVNTGLGIFAVIGIITLMASFVFAIFVPLAIKDITEISLFRVILIILGLNFALGFPLRVFSGILLAHLRFDLHVRVELFKLFLRTVFIIIFLKQFGIISLALITFFCDIFCYFIKYLMVRRLYKDVAISIKLFKKNKIKQIFHYSAYSFVIQIAEQLMYNFDNLVIAFFIGLNPVTLYSIGARLVKYFRELVLAALGMSFPLFSQYDGANDYESIKEKYLFLTKISSYFSIIAGSVLLIFGKVFIMRWVGAEYSDAHAILIILLIPAIFDMMQINSSNLLFGVSKHKFLAVLTIIEGVSNLVLSIILVRRFGIFGVALGTAIPMLVIKIFVQPFYVCKVIGIRPIDFYLRLMAPIVGLSLVVVIFFWIAIKGFIMPNYLNIAILSILESTIFILFVIRFGFTKQELRFVKEKLTH
jgi:O-antigen/teichoic acid export membrane protein